MFMARRRKHSELSNKLPMAATREDNLLPLEDFISRKEPKEPRYRECRETALVPMMDIYSAKALLKGVETSLEKRIISMEVRLTERIKERDWRIMEKIRLLQEQQKRKRPWWRWWD